MCVLRVIRFIIIIIRITKESRDNMEEMQLYCYYVHSNERLAAHHGQMSGRAFLGKSWCSFWLAPHNLTLEGRRGVGFSFRSTTSTFTVSESIAVSYVYYDP